MSKGAGTIAFTTSPFPDHHPEGWIREAAIDIRDLD
jgi:hypothetical protein